MARQVVLRYAVAWDMDDGAGKLRIQTEGHKPFDVPFKDPSALGLVLAILQNERPVFLDPDRRVLLTGPEPVGGDA